MVRFFFVVYSGCVQSRSQSPRSSVRGIVGLWENAEENQPLIGCLIISLTHSLLVEIPNKVTLFARSNAIGCIILIGGRGGRRIIAYICFISVQ